MFVLNKAHAVLADRGLDGDRECNKDLPKFDRIPVMYTDSDEETDELKKKISFLELEDILKGIPSNYITASLELFQSSFLQLKNMPLIAVPVITFIFLVYYSVT